jgi:hypothetical protein
MEVEGEPAAAHALFVQAWEARRDAYDACIAAHFLARHQPSPELALHWNRVAVAEARRIEDGRAGPLLASLYLNLANSHRAAGDPERAAAAADLAGAALAHLEPGGYRDFIAMALRRLRARLEAADAEDSAAQA